MTVYRWPIGFFFALIAVPFVAVWLITQGPKAFDQISPTYTVLKIGEISDADLGMTVKDTTFRLNRTCHTPGSIYLSGTYQEGGLNSEVLIQGDQAVDDNPLFIKHIGEGETFTVPEMRFIISKSLLAKLDHFRFVIPCHLPLIGNISAYTNVITIN